MHNSRTLFLKARDMVANGFHEEGLSLLRTGFSPDTEFPLLARAVKWSGTVEWELGEPLRVAILGGGSLEQLADFIRFWMILEGIAIEIYLPPFGTWRQEILNQESGLYHFKPNIVWLFTHRRDINMPAWSDADRDTAKTAAAAAAEDLSAYWRILSTRLPGVQLIQNNSDPDPERIFSNYGVMLPGSAGNLIHAFNANLLEAALRDGVLLFDLEGCAINIGLARWCDYVYWYHSKHPFAPSVAGQAAFEAARVLAAFRRGGKKAVILDLDNTLWGGVVGDDGWEGITLGNGAAGEAFAAFQAYLKELSRRGVILAVSSKNELAAAREPFEKHPAMRLSLSDISVFKANWRNKADNIREIAQELNLGLDAFVFLDDNPTERELVRRELPMLAVPELPVNPALYIPFLDSMRYFETVSYSAEDRQRGRMYRENAQRRTAMAGATDMDAFLKSLDMYGRMGTADDFHLPRMAQLVNKSNQFHPTTTRYTESELRALADDASHIVRWFSLRDCFGDHGLIAVLVLRREGDAFAFDTWAMSCRVLERGMEKFILAEMAAVAEERGAARLIGRYFPTAKNALVEKLYSRLGFSALPEKDGSSWELRLPLAADGGGTFIKNDEGRKGNE